MVTPDEEYDQYVKDPRTPCKFGIDCYQRNPLHHQKYKHPPKKRSSSEDNKQFEQPSTKKRKVDKEIENGGHSSKTKVIETVSDSDSSEDEVNDVADSVKEDEEQSNGKLEEEFNDNMEESNDAAISRSPSKTKVIETVSDSDSSEEEFNDNMEESNDAAISRTPAQFDKKAFIKEKFLVDMPEDFYIFWDFCKKLKSSDPKYAFTNAGLTLVGPYDVLADKFSNIVEKSPEDYLIHWRYYYDPPEFQTVIKGNDSTGYHIGYFRDDPNSPPVFLAGNHAKKNGEFNCMGENIFAAVKLYLEETKKSCDPFKKMNISKLINTLEIEANKLKLNLSEKTSNIKERDKKILSRTFNKIGLVVPYNKKTQVGYRHLIVSDKELRTLLDRVVKASDLQRNKVISEVQSVLTATSIATDECDFGTGIELGWDILAHGVETLNSTIERFLSTGYELLQRSTFAKIIAAHMKNRQKDTNLSIV